MYVYIRHEMCAVHSTHTLILLCFAIVPFTNTGAEIAQKKLCKNFVRLQTNNTTFLIKSDTFCPTNVRRKETRKQVKSYGMKKQQRSSTREFVL